MASDDKQLTREQVEKLVDTDKEYEELTREEKLALRALVDNPYLQVESSDRARPVRHMTAITALKRGVFGASEGPYAELARKLQGKRRVPKVAGLKDTKSEEQFKSTDWRATHVPPVRTTIDD